MLRHIYLELLQRLDSAFVWILIRRDGHVLRSVAFLTQIFNLQVALDAAGNTRLGTPDTCPEPAYQVYLGTVTNPVRLVVCLLKWAMLLGKPSVFSHDVSFYAVLGLTPEDQSVSRLDV